jgi:hypothetical protein
MLCGYLEEGSMEEMEYPLKSLHDELTICLLLLKNKRKAWKKITVQLEKVKRKERKRMKAVVRANKLLVKQRWAESKKRHSWKYEEHWGFIVEVLSNHVGAENTIYATELDTLIFPEKYENPRYKKDIDISTINRELRATIAKITEMWGIPILNLQCGYFIAETIDEVQAYLDLLESHKTGLSRRQDSVVNSLTSYFKDSALINGRWRKITKII